MTAETDHHPDTDDAGELLDAAPARDDDRPWATTLDDEDYDWCA